MERSFFSFSYFVNHGIVSQPDAVTRLVQDLKSFALVPNIVQGMQINPNQGMIKVLQLQLISTEEGIRIDFDPFRYHIQFLPLPGIPLPSDEILIGKIEEIMSVLVNYKPQLSNRLAVVRRDVSKIKQNEELVQINRKIFTLPVPFKTIDPVEWSTRQVIRKKIDVHEIEDEINIVFDISAAVPMNDRLMIYSNERRLVYNYDINTIQFNQNQRFNRDHIKPFIYTALKTIGEIEKQMEDMVNG
jgi:hypothetical protein